MKGKKTCPSCSSVVAARASSCSCGHTFFEKRTPPPKKAEQSSGRGRKQCPSCKTFHGVRTQKCPCGYEFVLSAKTEFPEAPRMVGGIKRLTFDSRPAAPKNNLNPPMDMRLPVLPGISIDIGTNAHNVLVPAGLCPVVLKDFSDDGILKWATDTFVAYREKNSTRFNVSNLTVGALEYFARQFTKGDAILQSRVKSILYARAI